MIPGEELVVGCLKTALAAYAGDEEAFRSVYQGWGTDRVDRLWAAMLDPARTPSVWVEYDRKALKVPIFYVQTATWRPTVSPSGSQPSPLAHDESVEVVIYAGSPSDVEAWARLCLASIQEAAEVVFLQRVGCNGVVFEGSGDCQPAMPPVGADVPQGFKPDDLWGRVLSLRIMVGQARRKRPDGLTPSAIIDQLVIVREGYSDNSFDPPVAGAVAFNRPDDETA